MSFLIHICFDNSSLFARNVYYFEYKNIRFKLIQNNSYKRSDVLLTIVSHKNREEEKVYLIASEYLSALSFRNNSLVKMWKCGGISVSHNFELRKAKCRAFDFHRTPLGGYYIEGGDINKIPEIENEEQKNALILFKEANSSNNIYLSFLFYWQILETAGTNAEKWVNKVFKNSFNEIRVNQKDIDNLQLKGKSLGEYFRDDCRNAIAHIKRKRKGKTSIKLDNSKDNYRINISTRIIKEFAITYIYKQLKLNKSMYLVRYKGKGFPLYVKQEELRQKPYKIAYPRENAIQLLGKRRRLTWHTKKDPFGM